MKVVIQRVQRASVTIDGQVHGAIGKGYLVLLGVGHEDDEKTADRIVKKMINLRIFPDENGKTNLSLKDVGGSLLVVSQFTLYADCRKGNRPSFTKAGNPELAESLYEYFLEGVKKRFGSVQAVEFGAYMLVDLENDGPFTLVWDSRDWE